MRNRLTFPSAGMETKYLWDRYNIQNNGIYIWDKHNVIEETKYYWDKYTAKEEIRYYWKKYSIKTEEKYKWHRYPVSTTNEPVWNLWLLDVEKDYINFVFDGDYELDGFDTKTRKTGYVVLYGVDDEGNYYNKILDVTELLANEIRLWDMVYSQLWFGASFADTLADIDYENPQFLGECNITPATTVDGDCVAIIGHRIISGVFDYAYRGEPVSSIENQYTEDYRKRARLLKQSNTAPDGDETFQFYGNFGDKDETGNFISVTQELQNSKYTAINDSATGYLVDFDNYEVLTSTSPNTYPNELVLGPNFNSRNYYYEPYGPTQINSKGDYIELISSDDDTTYPADGEQDGYWYVSTKPGIYYWDVYNTKIKEYLFDAYEYNATTIQKYVATKYELSAPGVTFKRPIYEIDETTDEVYISDYIEITLGELTDVYWPEGGKGSTNIAFWMDLDNPYDDNSTYSGTSIKPITTFALYNESLVDYNRPIGEGSNVLYGKKMLDYTGAIGMGFAGTDRNRQHSYYLFTPETTWGRETGTGAIRFNNVRPMIFSSDVGGPNFPVTRDAGFGWEPGNTATTENKGCYVDYIHTIKREWDEDFEDWRINDLQVEHNVEITDINPIFYKLPGYYYPTIGGNFTYKDYENGYYYDIENCYYNGEIGEYIGATSATFDARDYFPERLTSATSSSVYYELTGYEYGKGGRLIGQVSSREENAYPADGMIEGNNEQYYVYSHFEEDDSNYLKGEFIEEVESTNPNEYPLDSYQGQNWYVYTGSKLFKYAGDYIETVNAETINAYPKDGITGGYWYIYQGYENNGPYKSRWVDEVETNNSTSYPLDGIQGNYWYVYKKSYDGYKLQINDWQIKGGVNYKHNINPEKDFTIGCVSSAEIDFDYDNTADDFQQYLDEKYCDYWTWQPEDSNWRLIGRFWLEDAVYNRSKVQVKAFDAIVAFDTYVDDFIANTTYPISVTNFFNNLCQLLGVTGQINSSLTNRTFTFQDNFEAVNITARQLLQYIAEATGGFIKVEPDGTLHLTTYSSSGKRLDNSNYTSYAKQRYTVEPISGLTVKMNSDDLGVSSGDVENNPYIIENNPLFYAQSDEEIADAVYRLYNNINDKVYRPATIQLLQDFGINCGDIITINGDTFYVMNKELSASGCKLECFGNQYRDKKPQSINSDIVALRGKTNELYRDLEMTQSTLTDTANGLQSQITQTAEEINLRVTNEVAGLESQITQTADSITSTVTDEINEAKSEIKQTTDSISLTVQEQGDLVAQLVLDVDGISARGYVTFTDLAGSGTTTINGDNITTGTISADRINMTGAISWGDLSTSCKDTIASYAGSDADVPDYIHNTYIDAVRIVSPTIQGGTVSAGTTAEGYMKMSSSGMDFKSNTEGNLMGIGFYPGRYNYPYIIFGDGVDSVGTDRGMIKKYSWGIWIGDNDAQTSDEPTGTGIMIDFVNHRVLKYEDGTPTEL